MKLTKQQISELTETQLNLAMIWCYPPEGRSYMTVGGDGVYYNQRERRFYEWLSDWNILMPLVVENKLTLQAGKSTVGWFAYDHNGGGPLICRTAQRALCECLVYLKVGV